MIRRMLAALTARLRPSGAELYRLVMRETEPAAYREFEPITPGPVLAAAALLALGAYGALAAPFRLLRPRR